MGRDKRWKCRGRKEMTEEKEEKMKRNKEAEKREISFTLEI
jgi:hypothetical protein